jgi:hypothetical protein
LFNKSASGDSRTARLCRPRFELSSRPRRINSRLLFAEVRYASFSAKDRGGWQLGSGVVV